MRHLSNVPYENSNYSFRSVLLEARNNSPNQTVKSSVCAATPSPSTSRGEGSPWWKWSSREAQRSGHCSAGQHQQAAVVGGGQRRCLLVCGGSVLDGQTGWCQSVAVARSGSASAAAGETSL